MQDPRLLDVVVPGYFVEWEVKTGIEEGMLISYEFINSELVGLLDFYSSC